ncbi:hypothetical protein [Paenibacillus elgii]|nr:hypothetical protein [Paenibacillus elgii]
MGRVGPGRSADQFAPLAHTTRVEAALLLERLLKQLHLNVYVETIE